MLISVPLTDRLILRVMIFFPTNISERCAAYDEAQHGRRGKSIDEVDLDLLKSLRGWTRKNGIDDGWRQ